MSWGHQGLSYFCTLQWRHNERDVVSNHTIRVLWYIDWDWPIVSITNNTYILFTCFWCWCLISFRDRNLVFSDPLVHSLLHQKYVSAFSDLLDNCNLFNFRYDFKLAIATPFSHADMTEGVVSDNHLLPVTKVSILPFSFQCYLIISFRCKPRVVMMTNLSPLVAPHGATSDDKVGIMTPEATQLAS